MYCKKLLREVGDTVRINQHNLVWRRVEEHQGFKTAADIKCHELLVAGLTDITPNIEIFSEEKPHEIRERPPVYWLIDPIDGTLSWFGGFSGFVCQIAYVASNKVLFCAVYWPSTGELFSVEHGTAFNNNVEIEPPRLNEPPILVDNYPEPRGIALKVIKTFPDTRYKECGSIGLKALFALTGRADVFVKETRFRDWDVAPAIGFLDVLGGVISDLKGEQIELGKQIEFENGLLVSHSLKLSRDVTTRIEKGVIKDVV